MRADSHAGLRYCCPILTHVRICRFFFLNFSTLHTTKKHSAVLKWQYGHTKRQAHELANRRTSASTSCRCERTKWHRAQEPLNIHSSESSTPKKCCSTCCIPLLFTKWMTNNQQINFMYLFSSKCWRFWDERSWTLRYYLLHVIYLIET